VGNTLRWLVLAAAALATIGCDRATKHAATVLLAGEPDRSYLADTLRLGYTENTGGFLSLGADLPRPARTAVFTIATGFALLALLALAVRGRFAGLSGVGLVLFVAGGASNWIDRVLSGSVVDFLNVGIGPLRTGVFNVADVAIMVGAGIVAFGAARREPPRRTREGPTHGTPWIGPH
jgi:signal peptidase II